MPCCLSTLANARANASLRVIDCEGECTQYCRQRSYSFLLKPAAIKALPILLLLRTPLRLTQAKPHTPSSQTHCCRPSVTTIGLGIAALNAVLPACCASAMMLGISCSVMFMSAPLCLVPVVANIRGCERACQAQLVDCKLGCFNDLQSFLQARCTQFCNFSTQAFSFATSVLLRRLLYGRRRCYKAHTWIRSAVGASTINPAAVPAKAVGVSLLYLPVAYGADCNNTTSAASVVKGLAVSVHYLLVVATLAVTAKCNTGVTPCTTMTKVSARVHTHNVCKLVRHSAVVKVIPTFVLHHVSVEAHHPLTAHLACLTSSCATQIKTYINMWKGDTVLLVGKCNQLGNLVKYHLLTALQHFKRSCVVVTYPKSLYSGLGQVNRFLSLFYTQCTHTAAC